jgi:polyhydroxyalkanoate synthesis regulator phasin
MSNKPLIGRLKSRATDAGRALGKRALEELLTQEQRSEAFELAAKGVSEGRRLLDEQFERLFAALGLATQADLDSVSRKVGRLRRRLETLVEHLAEDRDAREAEASAPAPAAAAAVSAALAQAPAATPERPSGPAPVLPGLPRA